MKLGKIFALGVLLCLVGSGIWAGFTHDPLDRNDLLKEPKKEIETDDAFYGKFDRECFAFSLFSGSSCISSGLLDPDFKLAQKLADDLVALRAFATLESEMESKSRKVYVLSSSVWNDSIELDDDGYLAIEPSISAEELKEFTWPKRKEWIEIERVDSDKHSREFERERLEFIARFFQQDEFTEAEHQLISQIWAYGSDELIFQLETLVELGIELDVCPSDSPWSRRISMTDRSLEIESNVRAVDLEKYIEELNVISYYHQLATLNELSRLAEEKKTGRQK